MRYNLTSEKYDLTGQRFGLLTVQEEAGILHGERAWLCQCDCGTYVKRNRTSLVRGKNQNCGCYTINTLLKNTLKHGKSNTREYTIWQGMKRRCLNHNVSEYKYYGARGIKVCDKWLNNFQAFLDDMGIAPEGASLDRINNDGNYEPSNCRWATMKEQNSNKRHAKTLHKNHYLRLGKAVKKYKQEHGNFPAEIRMTTETLQEVLKQATIMSNTLSSNIEGRGITFFGIPVVIVTGELLFNG